MGIRKYKGTTNGRRNMTGFDFAEITKTTPEKSLLAPLKHTAGRNNYGHMTVRHRGGGTKRQYRIIDFKRIKDNVPATVKAIEYDPNRTANIALLVYADGVKSYILAPKGLKVGMQVQSGPDADIKVGNALPLKNMNPNDHPHGGGEGKAPVGLPSPLSPWGKKTVGKKTRSHKARSNKFIVRGRKRGPHTR